MKAKQILEQIVGREVTQRDAFTTAYIEAALWSSTDNATPSGGAPLDDNYSVYLLAPETLAEMEADCAKFQAANAEDLAVGDTDRGGHDFWLTRCGHGAGFWDGDWPEPQATRLTDAAHAFGNYDLYVGDDGKIYGSSG